MVVELKNKTEFEPKIVMFACNWCSYSGIDLAGTSRMSYPPNVTIIRTMCSGRVEPSFIMKSFANGLDGVIVSSCHQGDCHYIDGNMKSLRRVKLMQHLLDGFGIERERVNFVGISASEGVLAVDTIVEMIETIRKLGPLELEVGR